MEGCLETQEYSDAWGTRTERGNGQTLIKMLDYYVTVAVDIIISLPTKIAKLILAAQTACLQAFRIEDTDRVASHIRCRGETWLSLDQPFSKSSNQEYEMTSSPIHQAAHDLQDGIFKASFKRSSRLRASPQEDGGSAPQISDEAE